MNVDETLTHESALHTSWNNDIPPALHVESGAIVQFDCLNDSGSRITPETDSSDLPDIEFVGHHLTGPVAVDGAEPGTYFRSTSSTLITTTGVFYADTFG